MKYVNISVDLSVQLGDIENIMISLCRVMQFTSQATVLNRKHGNNFTAVIAGITCWNIARN